MPLIQTRTALTLVGLSALILMSAKAFTSARESSFLSGDSPLHVTITDFCVDNNGATISTDCIAAAIEGATEKGKGGIVRFPSGKWYANVVVSKPVRLIGAGKGLTIIAAPDGNSDTIKFVSPAGAVFGSVEEMTVTTRGGALTAISGCAINIGAGSPFGGVNIKSVNPKGAFNGICVDQQTAGATKIVDVDLQDIVNDGIRIVSTKTLSIERFSTFQSAVQGGVGIHILSGEGIHIANGNTSLQAVGLLIDPINAKSIANVWLANVDFDASKAAGVRFDCSNGGTARNIHGINVRTGFANNGRFTEGYGTDIVGDACQSISLIGGEDVRNTQEGLRIRGGKHIKIIGRLVQGNSVGYPRAANGIDIRGGDDISVIGGSMGTYTDRKENFQNFGIALHSSFKGSAVIYGNNLMGNLGGSLLNSSPSKDVKIRDNIGFVSALDQWVGLSGTSPGQLESCGSSSSVSGTDHAFTLAIGAAPITSCTIAFGHDWGNAPRCSASTPTLGVSVAVKPSRTNVALTFSIPMSETSADVLCLR